MSQPRSLAAQSGRLGVVAAGVRILGFGRWIVFGATVGATHLGNAYQTANWVPNVLFDVIAGGLLSSVLVPAFVAGRRDSVERESELASGVLNLLLIFSVPVVLLGIVLREQIMLGFTVAVADPVVRAQMIDAGSTMLVAFLVQIPFYMLGMVLRGYLHANDRFVLPQITPAFASIVQIGAYVWFAVLGAADVGGVTQQQLAILGWGTTLGVVLWAVVQIPTAVRLGFRWRPVFGLRDTGIRRLLTDGGWGLGWYAVTQIGFVGALVLANRFEGGVVAFQIAFAFYELPNALVGFPVATTAFPALTRMMVEGAQDGFSRLLSKAVRLQAVFLVPASLGLAVVAKPLLEFVFSFADAGRARPDLTAEVLATMALGLPAYALTQTLVRAFYARGDTATPVWFNIANVASFLLVAVTVGGGLVWLGAAHAFGQIIGALGIGWALSRSSPWSLWPDLRRVGVFGARATVAVAPAVLLVRSFPGAVGMASGVVAAVVVYVLASRRDPDFTEAVSALR